MKPLIDKTVGLGEVFNQFFVCSEHALCIWDFKEQTLVKSNPSFDHAIERLEAYSKKDNLAEEINRHNPLIKETYLSSDFILLECDEFLFGNDYKTANDYELLQEENKHANMQAKELSQKLKSAEFQFQNVAKIAPVGILFTNRKLDILWSNYKGIELFGSKAIVGQPLVDLVYVEDISTFYEEINNLKKVETDIKIQFTISNLKTQEETYIKCSAISLKKLNNEPTYIFILEDHTENAIYSEEIKKRNIELTTINNELDKFLYSVSHNIRGPVASLQGLLNVINISDIKTVNELKHHLRLNLRLLDSFVEDIKNVATNIHTNIRKDEVQLINIVTEVVNFFQNIYNFDVKVNFNIPIEYMIFTDPERLKIILKNLLKNAFQYQDKDKSKQIITISVKRLEEIHFIEMVDNGIGIPEDQLPKVFNMFHRGSELSSGNGLGLYNSREILKKIGGTINIESENRVGTSVRIYLPAI